VFAVLVMIVMFTFGVFGAAVFAEPAVTQVEEVGGLVHRRRIPDMNSDAAQLGFAEKVRPTLLYRERSNRIVPATR
jgi:hypothetical protein